MPITARFACLWVKKHPNSEMVRLVALGEPENASWSEREPFGAMKLLVNNPDAKGKFEPGKTYTLTIDEEGEG